MYDVISPREFTIGRRNGVGAVPGPRNALVFCVPAGRSSFMKKSMLLAGGLDCCFIVMQKYICHTTECFHFVSDTERFLNKIQRDGNVFV